MTLTERYKRMMLRLGYDPELRAGSMTPYDVGQIIVACMEEERQEAADAASALVESRLEDDRRLQRYGRYMSDLYATPFRWPSGGGTTR